MEDLIRKEQEASPQCPEAELRLLSPDNDIVAASKACLALLKKTQDEYMRSSGAYGSESAWRQRLVELMRAEFEADAPIPVKTDSLPPSMRNINKAFLVSDLVVVTVDFAGDVKSTPLQRLPAATVIAVAQDSIPQLKDLILDRKERAAKRVVFLEELVRDLKSNVPPSNLGSYPVADSRLPVGQSKSLLPPLSSNASNPVKGTQAKVELKPGNNGSTGEAGTVQPRDSLPRKKRGRPPKSQKKVTTKPALMSWPGSEANIFSQGYPGAGDN